MGRIMKTTRLLAAGALALGLFTGCDSCTPFYPIIQVSQSSQDINVGDTYAFGEVNVGASETLVFTISNIGKSELILTNTPPVTLSADSNFSVSSQPLTVIAEGGSVDFH